MKAILEVLKTCIPIIVGALIAIIPTLVEKIIDRKNDQVEQQHQKKQEMYVELISLFSKVLKEQKGADLNMLRDRINLISITGSVDVVKALNDYIDTWGKKSGEVQTQKYSDLLKVIRVDLKIDKSLNNKFPVIGLRDINIKYAKVNHH